MSKAKPFAFLRFSKTGIDGNSILSVLGEEGEDGKSIMKYMIAFFNLIEGNIY